MTAQRDGQEGLDGRPVDAVWTVPNAISALRIVLIVVFGALLAARQDTWAIIALMLAGFSDFLDGWLARRWNQVSRIGRLLDPAADRLLTVVVVLGLAARGIVPWWLVAVLLVRDLVVAIALVHSHRHHIESPQVTFTGKAATFGLYVSLPLAYLAFDRWDTFHTVTIIGAAVAAVLYWISGIGYVRDIIRRSRRGGFGESPGRAYDEGQQHEQEAS
ncbi:CDP-alcohol phosphatidyltransferase family protein [Demequina pelophila]|uniref:CDP-alcohol phosphatidyltransferase family protein n=1 Tax=Demequina pelophila TaxID=1638984 RepID=UPI00078280C5|nr:CDP-alcohol phosphatidyltransferase family protein [Demequina pelophila]